MSNITKISKIECIVYFIINWCDSKNLSDKLGTVKLNKILWFSDKYYFKEKLKSLTGTEFYYKKERGPVYPHLPSICEKMQKENLINIEKKFTFTKFTSNSLPSGIKICLSKEEKTIITEVADIICNDYTSDEISVASHGIIWNIVDMDSKIPVYASLADDGAGIISKEELESARTQEGKK